MPIIADIFVIVAVPLGCITIAVVASLAVRHWPAKTKESKNALSH